MTNYPKPTEPTPIYGGKVEPIKIYVNGKEVPFEGNLAPIMRGTFDNDTGIVKTWKPIDLSEFCECENCRKAYKYKDLLALNIEGGFPKFCPNCGSQMSQD